VSAGKAAQRIGRFEIVRRIGSGGQGTVFEARDPKLDRPVAIKLIHSDQVASDRPPLEERILARLRHPNIVSIFEVGEFGSMPYLVFEYIEGPTLRSLLGHQQGLAVDKACALMGQVLEGAAYAHARSVLHLDLTPSNIIMDPDRVPRIMDFGLARRAGHQQPSDEYLAGTLHYMTPEHFEGPELGAHTDVFALCLIFYELLTGRPALDGNSTHEIAHQLLHGSVDFGPLTGKPQLEPLVGVLRGGLERDPRARYPNAAALRAALSAAMKTASPEGARAGPHSTVEFFLRRMERKKDFPALSRSLADINRLTSSTSMDSKDERLATVILRDYALTNKLLKLANSAFYGGGGSREVTNVTQAIRLLGYEQIRMTANSLCYAMQLQSNANNPQLKEAITKSFLSGLITRHLARQANLPGMEEAFICGIFRNIGEHLTLHYFPEEYADIVAFMAERRVTKAAAARSVLGISFAELGAGVGRVWKLPTPVLAVIGASPEGGPTLEADPEERLPDYAVFANELCEIPGSAESVAQATALNALCERFAPRFSIDEAAACRVLEAAFEKLGQFAPILGLDTARSEFCADLRRWLRWRENVTQPNRTHATAK
jgi:serine/threonine protein kinase